jgi:poly(A) polymerase
LEPRIIARSDHPVSRRDIDPNVLKVFSRLIAAGHVAYLVGGGVRDLMLGRRPKDFDVGTSAHPQQVRDLFRNSRLIGRRFRLIHVFFGQQNIEVATFRRLSEDPPPDGDDPMIRHDNTFGTPEEDAFRRDFTVNSLFYDPKTFQVIDFTGGVADLEARLIRSIGDPELRMREDPVRMMRAVRFAAKLGFDIEPATRAAIERHHADLAKASVPRLVEETYRTLGQVECARALTMMRELGLLGAIFPFHAEHLDRDGAAATLATLESLGRAMNSGIETDRAMMLAAIFLDFFRIRCVRESKAPFDLVGELRAHGFARSDTEHMRLLLDAFALLARPTSRTRRLVRRPYFATARALFDIAAPTYGIDTGVVDRFLADANAPHAHAGAKQAAHSVEAGIKSRPRRRRRRGVRPVAPPT